MCSTQIHKFAVSIVLFLESAKCTKLLRGCPIVVLGQALLDVKGWEGSAACCTGHCTSKLRALHCASRIVRDPHTLSDSG